MRAIISIFNNINVELWPLNVSYITQKKSLLNINIVCLGVQINFRLGPPYITEKKTSNALIYIYANSWVMFQTKKVVEGISL